MRILSFLQLIILTFPTFTAQSQHKYYFAANSTRAGNGSKQQPFTSLQSLTHLTLSPGDSLFFHAGDTFPGNVLLDSIHGTAKGKIVFTSFGKGRSIINGKNGAAFTISNSSHFEIENLILLGAGRKTGNTTDGVKLLSCKNVEVKNLNISGFQKSGLELYNCENVEVNSVVAHENGAAGILVEGDYKKKNSRNIHIVNCKAENNPGDPTNLDNHSGNGILVGNCKNVLIEYCTATNNGWDMPRVGNGPVGIWAYQADSVIIQRCISYRNKTAKGAADGGGFDLDGGVTNSVIQYCLSYENWGSGYGIFEYNGADKWDNNTIRYCISINDGLITDYASGMLIWNGWDIDSMVTRFYAYNNLFYNDSKYSFAFINPGAHRQFVFLNNVFIASDTSDIFYGIDSSKSDIFLGNVWMRQSGGFAQNGFHDIDKWASTTGYEQKMGKLVGSSFKRQLFRLATPINITDPYSLKTDSLLNSLCSERLHNKGIDIRKLFSIDVGKTDFFGRKIPLQVGLDPGICQK